jgi:hypothetical protein
MNTAHDLLSTIEGLGVKAWVEGDKVVVKPVNHLPEGIIAAIRRLKPQLHELLLHRTSSTQWGQEQTFPSSIIGSALDRCPRLHAPIVDWTVERAAIAVPATNDGSPAIDDLKAAHWEGQLGSTRPKLTTRLKQTRNGER